MKSVYVDNILHQKLKKLAQENGQTLVSLLNRLIREGIERIEKHRYHPQLPLQDPVGMFGTESRREIDIEETYGDNRYQGVGESGERF
jgi:hypothetical protein